LEFVCFEHDGRRSLGILAGEVGILDLAGLEIAGAKDGDLIALIRAGEATLDAVRAAVAADKGPVLDRADCRLLAPIPRPAKNIFCVGRNYREHVEEGYRARGTETKLPDHPQFFTKPPTAVIGPGDDVLLDRAVTQKLDYEGELGVIIGKPGCSISAADALDHVFGYTIINDVTARDLQRRHDQWFKGKGLDTSCPMGPALVHADAVADPQDLGITLTVNGRVRQRARTSQMIFDLPTIIATLSHGLTLEAGDVIATGTPSGVGYAMDPPRFLAGGDLMEVTIEGIGTLRNAVRDVTGEPNAT